MDGYRELYGSGQEVEVKRATHDGWIWVKARVSVDLGNVIRVHVEGMHGPYPFTPDSVRKPGEDKA